MNKQEYLLADREIRKLIARIESLEAELTHCAHLRTDQAARIAELKSEKLVLKFNVATLATRVRELEAQIPDEARLLKFGRLYASYPNESIMTLWEMTVPS